MLKTTFYAIYYYFLHQHIPTYICTYYFIKIVRYDNKNGNDLMYFHSHNVIVENILDVRYLQKVVKFHSEKYDFRDALRNFRHFGQRCIDK